MRLTNKNQILEGFDGYEIVKKLSDLEDIEEERIINEIVIQLTSFPLNEI